MQHIVPVLLLLLDAKLVMTFEEIIYSSFVNVSIMTPARRPLKDVRLRCVSYNRGL